MKLVVLAFLSTICGSQAIADISTILAPRSLPISPAVDYAAICNGAYGNKCADCSTMLICLGAAEPVANKCSIDAPYCDTTRNLCVAEIPAACTECDGPDGPCLKQFVCMESEGFFPHPSNCNQYFECYHFEAIRYNCPPGHSWDTDGMGCKQRTVASDCGTITCKTTDIYAPLSNNATFYAYCNVQTGEGIELIDRVLVAKCPSNLEKFDSIWRKCMFQCPAVGLYQHQQNPTFYYECYKSGSEILFRYKECSHGRQFNDAEQRCIELVGGVGRKGQSPDQKIL